MPRIARAAALAGLSCLVLAAAAAEEALYGFGRDATPEEIALIDIDVRPDGEGLPEGQGTFAAGQAIHEARCAGCHSDIAKNDAPWMPAWVGTEPGSVGGHYPYATTLFDYVRRAMPMDRPGSLSDAEVYAVMAFILGNAGLVDQAAVLDRAALLAVKMPNEANFIPQWPLEP